MSRPMLYAVALIALFLGSVTDCLACRCRQPPPPKQALAKSSAVFSGKVTAVAVAGNVRKVTIEVDRAWKGVKKKTATVTTNLSGAQCGYAFKQGQSYLVYCYSGMKTNICTRTKSLKMAKEDLEALGEGTAVGE